MQNALNQSPLYGAVILNRKPGNESQCVEAGVSLFTINSGDPRGNFCFLILTTITTGLKVLVPRGGTFLPGNTARVFIDL